LVLTACESDTVVATQFFKVAWLLDSPIRLLRPSFLYRVATVNLGRRQRHWRPRQITLRRDRPKTNEKATCTLS
jgi:hypothetical protein